MTAPHGKAQAKIGRDRCAASGSSSSGHKAPGHLDICDDRGPKMHPDDLISLKDDMVAFIEGHAMRRLPGYITEDLPTVLWEDDNNPDSLKDFVEMAKIAGAPFITMSEVMPREEDVAMLLEQIRDENYPDEDAAELEEAQYLVNFVGKVGYIQLGFASPGIVFVHENATQWYERYQQIVESVEDLSDMSLTASRTKNKGEPSSFSRHHPSQRADPIPLLYSRLDLPRADPVAASETCAERGLPLVVAELLVERGVRGYGRGGALSASADRSSARPLHDAGHDRSHCPHSSRFLKSREPILIYGDYDVDGTTAFVVLLKTTLELLGGVVHFHLPHRIRDGYGMQGDVLERALGEKAFGWSSAWTAGSGPSRRRSGRRA